MLLWSLKIPWYWIVELAGHNDPIEQIPPSYLPLQSWNLCLFFLIVCHQDIIWLYLVRIYYYNNAYCRDSFHFNWDPFCRILNNSNLVPPANFYLVRRSLWTMPYSWLPFKNSCLPLSLFLLAVLWCDYYPSCELK